MKNIFLILLIVLVNQLYADEFVVKSFHYNSTSQIATRAPRYDNNRQACALILVESPVREVIFTADQGVVGEVTVKLGKYYIYVPINTTQITFAKEGFENQTYSLPLNLRSSAVYDLSLGYTVTEIPQEAPPIEEKIIPEKVEKEIITEKTAEIKTEVKEEPAKEATAVIQNTDAELLKQQETTKAATEKTITEKHKETIENAEKQDPPVVKAKEIVPEAAKTIVEEKVIEEKPAEEITPKIIEEDLMLVNDIPLREAPEIENMVFVQGGCFNMGSHFGNSDELPIHKVCVDDFYIGKFEVTLREYIIFLNEIACGADGKKDNQKLVSIGTKIKYSDQVFSCDPKDEDLPATTVTWFGAKAYAEWAGGRLPTEAEWEFAAKGGLKMTQTIYAGNDSIYDVGLYARNSGNRPHPVGTKAPNELGIYDMSGNAYEWVEDLYHEGYYAKSPEKNPSGSPFGNSRVLRGGSFGDKALDCRVANRHKFTPANSFYFFGFRIVKPVQNN
ncbi:MAG: SUMF1/EgtB/PvdO family nonheme iron enzyme [Bacteroidales bacterium]|nr:SUMF1/EgtB/PvdO family nonheme iron enzyme [Bacteroidales bacterium]